MRIANSRSPLDVSADDLSLITLAFAPRLVDGNLRVLLAHLSDYTSHRFTGVYRFEPGWVISVALWDRENPSLDIGADVKMKESYCWLTGLGESSYIIEDATVDPRLDRHAARDEVRSYVAVLLRDKKGMPWGTLCHFDFAPRSVEPGTLARLEAVRPLVEEMIVKDARAAWDPDAPSIARTIAEA